MHTTRDTYQPSLVCSVHAETIDMEVGVALEIVAASVREEALGFLFCLFFFSQEETKRYCIIDRKSVV